MRRPQSISDGPRRLSRTRVKSAVWWIAYRVDGRLNRESARTAVWEEANKFLRRRLGEIVTGKFQGLGPERIKVGALLDGLLEDYAVNGRRNLYDVKHRLEKHVRPAFGDTRAAALNGAMVRRYISRRLGAGAANATVNREMATLRRSFQLGHQAELVVRVPYIEHLQEENFREGYLDAEVYGKLRDALPE